MIIQYTASVKTPAGWRSTLITAKAEQISDKHLRVIDVIDIEGSTGAKRQQYDAGYFASQEVGTIKMLNFVKIQAAA